MTLEAFIPGRAREIFRSVRSADSSTDVATTAPAPTPVEVLGITSVQEYQIDEKGNFRWIRDAEGNIVLKSKSVDRAIPVFEADDVFPKPAPATGIRGALTRASSFLTRNSH